MAAKQGAVDLLHAALAEVTQFAHVSRDIGGITLRKPRNTGAEIIDLRIGAKLNGTRIMARGTSSQTDHRPATPSAAVQASKIKLLRNKLTR